MIGTFWMSLGEFPGLCVVVADNHNRESPNSWVMHRVHDGKQLYMHEKARLKGEWRPIFPV
jgi:hypothetical protein